MSKPELHSPTHPVRFVTASALFDGHDASINIMRRILQAQGVEVIHLGHNRSVGEIVNAALSERVRDALDAQLLSDLRYLPARDSKEVSL